MFLSILGLSTFCWWESESAVPGSRVSAAAITRARACACVRIRVAVAMHAVRQMPDVPQLAIFDSVKLTNTLNLHSLSSI